MAEAHTEILRLLIESVAQSWVPPAASQAARSALEIEAAVQQAEAASSTGSKYTQAKAALSGAEIAGARIIRLEKVITEAVKASKAVDRRSSAELAMWCLGFLAERAAALERHASARQNELLALRTLQGRLAAHAEGWLEPYLFEGFRSVRETGGMDTLARWRHSVL